MQEEIKEQVKREFEEIENACKADSQLLVEMIDNLKELKNESPLATLGKLDRVALAEDYFSKKLMKHILKAENHLIDILSKKEELDPISIEVERRTIQAKSIDFLGHENNFLNALEKISSNTDEENQKQAINEGEIMLRILDSIFDKLRKEVNDFTNLQ